MEMQTLTQDYDEALHAVPSPSTLIAEALHAPVEAQLTRGEYIREEAFIALQTLFEQYADDGRADEREVMADVMDCFAGWSPPALDCEGQLQSGKDNEVFLTPCYHRKMA